MSPCRSPSLAQTVLQCFRNLHLGLTSTRERVLSQQCLMNFEMECTAMFVHVAKTVSWRLTMQRFLKTRAASTPDGETFSELFKDIGVAASTCGVRCTSNFC